VLFDPRHVPAAAYRQAVHLCQGDGKCDGAMTRNL